MCPAAAQGFLSTADTTQEPEPTATPILQGLGEVESEADITEDSIDIDLRSLSLFDWITLIVAAAIIVLVILFGRGLVTSGLRKLALRTETTFDDELIQRIQGQIRAFIVILVVDLATRLLTFLPLTLKATLANIYFLFYFTLVFVAFYRSIDFFFEWYEAQLPEEDEERKIVVFIPLLERVSFVLLFILAAIVLLEYIGVSVAGFAAALGLAGLALSLAAQDTIADVISGYTILLDRPFRVGDRIEIPGEDTWGDVTDIGTRTTRIRTRDNTLVIIPNSTFASGQIQNYSYPDPNYRLQSDLGIAYGSDREFVRKTFSEAVRGVEGFLPDQPVDVLFNEFGPSAMTFRVRWWIDSYADKRRMFDKVHSALQAAMEEYDIESPFPSQALEVEITEKAQEGASGSSRDAS
ncbi:MAG: mechanosensitive ion channel [Anaerolineales bacterium]|nr:mechanosensitive ion channel [Anaerolineales bacterium]